MARAMLKVESLADPVTDVTAFGVNDDQDAELGEFLDWALEGEPWEIYDGNEGQPHLEAWRQLARRFAPRGPQCQLKDTRGIVRPTRASNLANALREIQLW